MKIAIPLTDNRLSEHFGHCAEFAIFELADEGHSVVSKTLLTPPPHEPGVFPAWLKGLGVNLIVAGGMGRRALDLFDENGIRVFAGKPGTSADEVLRHYLENTLGTDTPTCNHSGDHHCS
jgi:predicted Fe-Mo cluster-binding NifX family protein